MLDQAHRVYELSQGTLIERTATYSSLGSPSNTSCNLHFDEIREYSNEGALPFFPGSPQRTIANALCSSEKSIDLSNLYPEEGGSPGVANNSVASPQILISPIQLQSMVEMSPAAEKV